MESETMKVAALCRDVFFGLRIRTVLQNLGHEMMLCQTETELNAIAPQANIALIDFNMPVDWQILEPVLSGNTPVVAFGAHTNVEGFRAAKSAGVTRVVSNGEFSRRLPSLLTQYQRELKQQGEELM